MSKDSNTPEHKYRVACCKNFVQATPQDVLYVYTDTKPDAVYLMKLLSARGEYQSEQGGNIPGFPHVAAMEEWNDEEQDWLFSVS